MKGEAVAVVVVLLCLVLVCALGVATVREEAHLSRRAATCMRCHGYQDARDRTGAPWIEFDVIKHMEPVQSCVDLRAATPLKEGQ